MLLVLLRRTHIEQISASNLAARHSRGRGAFWWLFKRRSILLTAPLLATLACHGVKYSLFVGSPHRHSTNGRPLTVQHESDNQRERAREESCIHEMDASDAAVHPRAHGCLGQIFASCTPTDVSNVSSVMHAHGFRCMLGNRLRSLRPTMFQLKCRERS